MVWVVVCEWLGGLGGLGVLFGVLFDVLFGRWLSGTLSSGTLSSGDSLSLRSVSSFSSFAASPLPSALSVSTSVMVLASSGESVARLPLSQNRKEREVPAML